MKGMSGKGAGRVLTEDTSPRPQRCTHHWKCVMSADRLMDGHMCGTPGCANVARLRCPTCIKLKLKDSFFCSQVLHLRSFRF